MLKMLLNKIGVTEIEMAEDGQEAVQKVVHEFPGKFHVLFMDNLMPVMVTYSILPIDPTVVLVVIDPPFVYQQNGVEATKALRKMGYVNLIVGVTGNVLDDDVTEYLSAGADIVLSKPMKIHWLETILSYVTVHGVESRPGMTLVERAGTLHWEQPNYQLELASSMGRGIKVW